VTSVDPVSGAATQVFDFDSLPEVTEVQVGGIGGDRYVTVLGGEGSLTPGFRAGQMYTADIVAGTWHQSSTWPYWCYQRPAAEPSGRFLVAERHLLTFKRLFEGGPLDTIMSKNSDLWLVRVF